MILVQNFKALSKLKVLRVAANIKSILSLLAKIFQVLDLRLKEQDKQILLEKHTLKC